MVPQKALLVLCLLDNNPRASQVHGAGNWQPYMVVRTVGMACEMHLQVWGGDDVAERVNHSETPFSCIMKVCQQKLHDTANRPGDCKGVALRDQLTDVEPWRVQAVFRVSVEAAKDADVLANYGVAVLRQILSIWLSRAPHVRRLLVLPALAMNTNCPASMGV